MPITFEEVHTGETDVIVLRVTDPWHWSDYENLLLEIVPILDNAEAERALIVDYSNTNSVPPGSFTSLRTFSPFMRHGKLAGVIIYGLTTRLGNIVVTMFSNLYDRVSLVDTWEDALYEARKVSRR